MADLFERLAVDDIQDAADALRPVYDRRSGRDGFVSLEVSPYLAMNTKGRSRRRAGCGTRSAGRI